MENIEEINKEFNSKKPKKKGLILGIALLVLVIVALISVCLINSSKPEKIYYSAIDKILKIEKSESNSIKLDTKTKITAESDDNTNEEELEKLAKCAFGFGVQTDAENKKEIVNLSLEYENNPEISAQLYYNNDAVYAYLDGIFDKYIKIELEDEQKEDLKTIFESAKSTAEQEKLDKAIEEIKKEIINMPNYFADYDTIVNFVSDKELRENHNTMPHGGFVIRSGKTGKNNDSNEIIEYSLKLDSNPEFTASVLVAYARAVYKLYQKGEYGAITIFDIPPALLSTKTQEELLKDIL